MLGAGGLGIILLALCCGLCLFPNLTGVQRAAQEARQVGDRFFALMQRGDFAGAELHIAPSERKHYSAAALRQRWSALRLQIGAVRDSHMMQYQMELDGLRSIIFMEYHIAGSKGDARARLRLTSEKDAVYIQSVEFVF